MLDPQAVQDHVCSFRCLICNESLQKKGSITYEVCIRSGKQLAQVVRKKCPLLGRNAMFRICGSCWKKIAGEQYCFDLNEYVLVQ